ncbi:MAG: hypothetical protein M3N32_02930 [Actinomycetota bacterium]|nr:hypothetical protein [Actinomycetota bacterium]
MARMETFEAGLEALGFVDQGSSRRGGRVWTLELNRFLTFTIHDFDKDVLLTWAFALGEFVIEQGMQIGAGETTFQELYPRADVRLPSDPAAVEGEIVRTLRQLRFDLGDPAL